MINFYSLAFSFLLIFIFGISYSQNVGIGTLSPVAKLDVAGDIALNDNQLKIRSGSDTEFYMTYNGNFNGIKLNAYDAVFITTSNPAHATQGQDLVVRGGRVGINTTTPSRGLFHVNGYYDYNSSNFSYYALGTSGGPCCGGLVDVSIYATNRIHAAEFNSFSDKRIKNIIGLSNSEIDLNIIRNIEITDYTMVDSRKGNKKYKKVIAQQVEEVYPSAVSLTTDVLPDIFTMSEMSAGFIPLKTSLSVGEKVKLILENKEYVSLVSAVSDKGFNVADKISGKVFVYGREVDDFRTVDYEAISMLNVSATQQLAKKVEFLEKQNELLRSQNSSFTIVNDDLRAIVENLKAEVNLIKKELNIELNK